METVYANMIIPPNHLPQAAAFAFLVIIFPPMLNATIETSSIYAMLRKKNAA
jgi:hypothetical protein